MALAGREGAAAGPVAHRLDAGEAPPVLRLEVRELPARARVPDHCGVVAGRDQRGRAAGGIVDGRGMAAACALGACGIQMGTRFMLSKEARICKEAEDFLLSRDGSETLVLGQRIGNKVNARVVMCPGVQKVLDYEALPCMTIPEYQKFTRGKSAPALFQGDLENGYISAGMGIGAIHEVLTCKEIVEKTMAEFHAIRRSLAE